MYRALKFSVIFLFYIIATFVVPSDVFGVIEEIKNTDELKAEKHELEFQEPDSNSIDAERKFIVIFKERPNQKDIDDIRSLGKIKNQFEIIPGVLAELKESQMNVLKNNGRVLEIYEDIKVTAFMDESEKIIHADIVQTNGITGTGVKVCIVDSGVDDSHPALNPLFAEIDFVNIDSDATDDYGHGTHVAGTVASQDSTFGGVSPGVSLMAAKVLDQNGSGYSSDVISGIQWCVLGPDGISDTGDEADIITMSLGGSGFLSSCDSDPMASVANAAVDAGLTVFAASGNAGYSDRISTPACGSKVIAVGAVDKSDNQVAFSNEGAELDIVAPGIAITSSVPTGSCTLCHVSGWKSLQGTSMATPHVAATAALLIDANPTLTNLNIRTILEESSLDLGNPGWDNIFGHGRVDANDAYIISIAGQVNTPPSTNADAYNTPKDIALNVAAPGVISNDTDPEGNTLTAVLDTNVTHGTLALNSNGSFSYTPIAAFTGDDSFTYHAFDGANNGNTVTVTITVTAVNTPPSTNADAYNTPKDIALNVAAPGVISNDTDPEGNTLTAVLDTNVTNGTLVLNSNGSFSYTPIATFTGDDSFTYHAFDGANNGNTVTVTITVTGSAGQLFFDDFESGQSKWIESGEPDWKIEPEAEVATTGHPANNLVFHADNCDTQCIITLAIPIDLSAHTSATLSFWRFVDNDMDAGEYLKVEAYDGTQWNTLFSWTNGAGDDNTWHQETFDLTGYLGTGFNLRFVTHESFWLEEVEIDDVLIEATT